MIISIIEAVSQVVVEVAMLAADLPSIWFSYQPTLPDSLKENKED